MLLAEAWQKPLQEALLPGRNGLLCPGAAVLMSHSSSHVKGVTRPISHLSAHCLCTMACCKRSQPELSPSRLLLV